MHQGTEQHKQVCTGGAEPPEQGIGPSCSPFPDYPKTLCSVFSSFAQDQISFCRNTNASFLLFSLKTSNFIRELHKFALEGQDQRLFFFLLYAPRDMKTKHFALPLIYHVVTQKYISKRETWEKGNSQMPLQTPSDKVARE